MLKTVFAVILFISVAAVAADTDLNSLLSIEKNGLQSGAKVYQGVAVYIDDPNPKPAVDTSDYLYEEKMRLFGRQDISNAEIFTPFPEQKKEKIAEQNLNKPIIPLKTIFGKEKKAVWENYIPDMAITVEVLSSGDIWIREQFQFLRTDEKQPNFTRTFANKEQKILSAFQNKQPIFFTKTVQGDMVTFTAGHKMTTGLHQMVVTYLIPNPFKRTGNNYKTTVGLLDFPIPVEHFSTIVLFPSATENKITPLFGKNKVSIPQAFSMTDNKKSISFYNKQVVPAYTSLFLEITIPDTELKQEFDWLPFLFAATGILMLAFFIRLLLYKKNFTFKKK